MEKEVGCLFRFRPGVWTEQVSIDFRMKRITTSIERLSNSIS